MNRFALLLVSVALGACSGSEPMVAGTDPVGPVTPTGPDGWDVPATAGVPGCTGATNAHVVLNAFWSAFDQRYALFDLRLPGESWEALGRAACAQVDARIAVAGDVTNDELFDILMSMARHLDDGHTDIDAVDIGRDEDALVSIYANDDLVEELETNAEESYIDEDELSRAGEDEISWGTIGDIGYLSITAMEELTPAADSDAGDADDHTLEVAAAREAMAAVMADLGDSSAIVVDVRANGGGWDEVSLEIARWFAGPRTVAWSEQRRNGPRHDDFGPWVDTFVEASGPEAFQGPVVLLTSGATFSAAEVFVLAMRVRSNVRVLGEPSSGHFSDQLEGTLPNGWDYDMSHERYRAADGQIYETRGAPVDQAVALDAAALAAGRDVMLDAALTLLRR